MSDTITAPADTVSGTDVDSYQDPPPTTVAVDIVLFGADGDRLRVLTIRRLWNPHAGCWALPGGLLEEDEDLAAAAVRELGEECGIHLSAEDLIEIGSSSDPKRDPRRRVLSVAFGAVLPDCPPPTAGDDASDARWTLAEAILDDPDSVAFDHHQIVVRAKTRLAEQIARIAPGAMPTIGRVETALRTFVATADGLDQDALATELEEIRKSELRDLLQGLDDARQRVAQLFGETTGQLSEFTTAQDDVDAVGECLEDAGQHLESVIHDLRP